MSLDITKRSGFILRLLSLAAFSCMVLFAGLVVLENQELGKLIPPTPMRTLAILFGYIVAIITFNYALATKGRNFMGWKNEALIMVGFILFFVGMFLPHGFPQSEVIRTESWIPLRSREDVMLKANWGYSVISAFALPFFFFAWQGIKEMPLWNNNKSS